MFFSKQVIEKEKNDLLEMYVRHIDFFEEAWGAAKNPATLKKFAKMYINGFEGASEIRSEAMQSKDLPGLREVVKQSII